MSYILQKGRSCLQTSNASEVLFISGKTASKPRHTNLNPHHLHVTTTVHIGAGYKNVFDGHFPVVLHPLHLVLTCIQKFFSAYTSGPYSLHSHSSISLAKCFASYPYPPPIYALMYLHAYPHSKLDRNIHNFKMLTLAQRFPPVVLVDLTQWLILNFQYKTTHDHKHNKILRGATRLKTHSWFQKLYTGNHFTLVPSSLLKGETDEKQFRKVMSIFSLTTVRVNCNS